MGRYRRQQSTIGLASGSAGRRDEFLVPRGEVVRIPGVKYRAQPAGPQDRPRRLWSDSWVLRVEVRIPTGGIGVFGMRFRGFSGLDGAGVLWGSSYKYLDVVMGAGSLLLELGPRRDI